MSHWRFGSVNADSEALSVPRKSIADAHDGVDLFALGNPFWFSKIILKLSLSR
jgi:hypothetical protein